MWGRGYSTHSVCVCVSVTALAGAMRTLRPQLRYQKEVVKGSKAGIELKLLSSKVMTVCSSPRILACGSKTSSAAHKHFSKTFGGSASSATNYCSLSFIK